MVLIEKETKRGLIVAGLAMIASLIIILALTHEWFLWVIFALTVFGTMVAAIWPLKESKDSLETAMEYKDHKKINALRNLINTDAIEQYYRKLFAESSDFVRDLAEVLAIKPDQYFHEILKKELAQGFYNNVLTTGYAKSLGSADPDLSAARQFIMKSLRGCYYFYQRKKIVNDLRTLVGLELSKENDSRRQRALQNGLEEFVDGMDIKRYWIFEAIFEEKNPVLREITRQYVIQNEHGEFDELGGATGAEAKKPIGEYVYRALRNFRSLSRREYEGLLKSGLALSANQD